jgi:homoserine dehydrogenase
MPAASAVVSDILFLARHVVEGTAGKLPYVTYDPHRRITILPKDQFASKYYLRVTVQDRPGVLSRITGILGANKVSIASVYQPEMKAIRKAVPVLLTTHTAHEGRIQSAIREINRLPFVKSKTVLIRIED